MVLRRAPIHHPEIHHNPVGYYGVATRNLRVTKWLGAVPTVAVCTQCARTFKVPLNSLNSLRRTSDAQENLRKQFAEHKCPEIEGK